MPIITTDKLNAKQGETLLDWAGRPYQPKQGQGYGGKPEHMSPVQKLTLANEARKRKPMTEETRNKLRQSLAYARSIAMARRKAKLAKSLASKAKSDSI